ncbi:MAG TPA: HDIG domain-containing protein, partial [Kofleriaceae bacterium]|nr:HDIG domain-containing protein [Kofleriaceae bacterium]
GGGVIVERGAVATPAQEQAARLAAASRPRGALSYVAIFALTFVFAALFTHHLRRSTRGRLLRVQIVTLATIAALALAVKALLLATSISILVVPVALLAIVPTMALDRVVGLATGVLAALITSLLVPFDVTVAILLLVQAAAAGLLVAEGPRRRWRAALIAGLVTTLLTAATLLLVTYLTRNAWPALGDPLRSPWLAAAIGPALAMVLAVPLLPLYQLLVGEVTHGKLVELADLSHPLLRQIAERAPGTWQHSLMMANLAEIAANAIGADGRLVRVGAYFHDLGKSLTPKYFIENLQPGETSPHDQLPPEASCEAIFAHVTEGIAAARRAGLHERIVDFMHMHHGDGVLEYFWGKTQEQGNPRGLAIEQFRYPGHPPQSRETAILAICDAVEAASRTLRKPEPAAIDALVQRIVYGKLHLGQLDESGLSMADLRRISDSLREAIRHANHGRIEYPWQKAQQDASASPAASPAVSTGTQPRLDSLDRRPRLDTAIRPQVQALPPAEIVDDGDAAASLGARVSAALRATPDDEDLGILETAPQTPPAREAGAAGALPEVQAAQAA